MGNKQCRTCQTKGDNEVFMVTISHVGKYHNHVYCRTCYDFKFIPDHICQKLDCIAPVESVRIRKIKAIYISERKKKSCHIYKRNNQYG